MPNSGKELPINATGFAVDGEARLDGGGEQSPAMEQGDGAERSRWGHAIRPVSIKSLREVFLELPSYSVGGVIRLGDIFQRLAGRGHALLLIVLALPGCLVPGVSVGFGVALVFFGVQMVLGMPPFLPRLLRERTLKLVHLEKLLPKMVRIAGWLERLLHPRMLVLFSQPWMMRAYGGLVLALAILLCLPLPIPFTNIIAGFPILILGMGLLERDGNFVIAGLVAAAVAFTFFSGIVFLGAEGVQAIMQQLHLMKA